MSEFDYNIYFVCNHCNMADQKIAYCKSCHKRRTLPLKIFLEEVKYQGYTCKNTILKGIIKIGLGSTIELKYFNEGDVALSKLSGENNILFQLYLDLKRGNTNNPNFNFLLPLVNAAKTKGKWHKFFQLVGNSDIL